MQGILTVAANTTKRKTNRFKALDYNSAVYAQTNLHSYLKMTVNKQTAIHTVLALDFKKFFHSQM